MLGAIYDDVEVTRGLSGGLGADDGYSVSVPLEIDTSNVGAEFRAASAPRRTRTAQLRLVILVRSTGPRRTLPLVPLLSPRVAPPLRGGPVLGVVHLPVDHVAQEVWVELPPPRELLHHLARLPGFCGSWLVACGSWLAACGSWLAACAF